MTSCTGSARRILGILKKVSWVENWTPNEKGRLSGFAEARRICALRAPHEMRWGRWKSQNRNNVYLSPYVEEPLNSKVIKSFVPELKNRVFCVSRFLCSMLWTFHVCFTHIRIWLWYIYIYIRTLWICPFHVSVSWVWYRWRERERERERERGGIVGWIPFLRVLTQCEMQAAPVKTWTRVTVSVFRKDNRCTTNTF